MSRTVDLDDTSAADLDLLWHEIQCRHASRNAEPQLFDAVVSRIRQLEATGELGRLRADQIRADLGKFRPSAVLSAYWRKLVPNWPALGHYLQSEVPNAA